MNFRQLLINIGLDISNPERLSNIRSIEIEAPARIGACNLAGSISIGAFTYLHDGFIHNTTIGRYCSIGRNFYCLQPNHPISSISTNPVFYHGFNTVFDSNLMRAAGYSDIELNKENFLFKSPNQTLIGNDVWIGTNVTIVNGVKIGNGVIIGAGSIVTKDIPDYAICAGNPAKILRYRFEQVLIDDLLESNWWNLDPKMLALMNLKDPSQFIKELNKDREAGKVIMANFTKYSKSDFKEMLSASK